MDVVVQDVLPFQEGICLGKQKYCNRVSFQMLENGDLLVVMIVIKLSTCKFSNF